MCITSTPRKRSPIKIDVYRSSEQSLAAVSRDDVVAEDKISEAHFVSSNASSQREGTISSGSFFAQPSRDSKKDLALGDWHTEVHFTTSNVCPRKVKEITPSGSFFSVSKSSDGSFGIIEVVKSEKLSRKTIPSEGAVSSRSKDVKACCHISSAPKRIPTTSTNVNVTTSCRTVPTASLGNQDDENSVSVNGQSRKKKQKPGKTAKMHDRHFVTHNYHDHAKDIDIDSEELASSKGDVSSVANCTLSLSTNSSSDSENHCHLLKKRGGVAVPFPLKLHGMLENVEEDGHGSVVSWQPHGRAFLVHNSTEFVEVVMSKYFRQTKLTSFQRQLNLYGFSRLTRGRDAGAYYHELFLRGKPFLCNRMARTKIKGTGFKAASSPESEPDFYSMPPIMPDEAEHPEFDSEDRKLPNVTSLKLPTETTNQDYDRSFTASPSLMEKQRADSSSPIDKTNNRLAIACQDKMLWNHSFQYLEPFDAVPAAPNLNRSIAFGNLMLPSEWTGRSEVLGDAHSNQSEPTLIEESFDTCGEPNSPVYDAFSSPDPLDDFVKMWGSELRAMDDDINLGCLLEKIVE